MTKKPFELDLGGMIDPDNAPAETGIPQRGVTPTRAPKAERRADQMSIRMKPSTRAKIQKLSKSTGLSIAEIIEEAVDNYRP